jgi:hypothetical protein
MRYSYVLYFPPNNIFSGPSHRWQNFLGEFVKPIVDKYPELLFWSTYYHTSAKLRVCSENQEVHDFIISKIQETGLQYNPEEEISETLWRDLGGERFIDQSLGEEAIKRRAEFTLKFLCCATRLYLDGLVKVNDTHWECRKTISGQNPLGNNFESLVHLIANISRFEFVVQASIGTAWQQSPTTVAALCRL